MRWPILLILLVLAMGISPLFSQGSTLAGGGNITPATLGFDQPLSRWFFFFSSSNSTANSTISFTESGVGGEGHFIAIAFPSTSGYYLLSDSSNPFSEALQPANLSAFDAHFNLSSTESASRLFNDTSNFNATAGTSTPLINLNLPTLYLSGLQDTRAFRIGLAQAGSHFVFVVPQTSQTGMDGNNYSFQFFLPYSFNQSMTFYVFSIVAPTPTPTPDPGGGVIRHSIDYRWAYDGKTLVITTVSDASITLSDVMGKTYNANSGQPGEARLDVLPGHYTLRISKSGYQELTDVLYLPEPVVPVVPPVVPKEPANVTITRSPQGITMCMGGECYYQTSGNSDEALMLSDLNCQGTLCELVGITPASFITKHQMKHVQAASVQARPNPPAAALDIQSTMDALGHELSLRLGSQTAAPSPFSLVALVVSLLAVALCVYWAAGHWSWQRMKPRGGYG